MSNSVLEQYMQKGVEFTKLGDWTQAIGYFKLVLDEDSQNVDAWFNSGKACYELKNYPLAIYCFTQLHKLEGEDIETLDMVGESYYHLGQFDMAEQQFRKALENQSSEVLQQKLDNVKQEIELSQKTINDQKRYASRWADEYYKNSIITNSVSYSWVHILLHYQYMQKIVEKIIVGRQDVSSLKILDLGCGDGKVLRDLLSWKLRPENLYGIDVSHFIIDYARKLSSSEMNFVQGTLDELPFENQQFDIILSRGVLQHIKDEETMNKVSSQIQRILKPEGTMIFYEAFSVTFGNKFFSDTTLNRTAEDYRKFFPAYQIECQPFLLSHSYLMENQTNLAKLYTEINQADHSQHQYQFIYLTL